jgi:chromosome segregation ATPase
MLKQVQKLIDLLFTTKTEQKHETVKAENTKLKRELAAARKENTILTKQHETSKEHGNLWKRKSADLQDKLSAALGHTTVLEGVLDESNKTIESLQLALELREKEETEGLQTYIDDLEAEIEEAVSLIQTYGLEMRKV